MGENIFILVMEQAGGMGKKTKPRWKAGIPG
jgi:hypothetical protein